VTTLNWLWIALMMTAPPAVGLLVAYPLWRQRQMILGNVAGTMVIFASGIAAILREYTEIDRATRACLDAGFTCWPQPSAFARYAVYAALALVEVFALFAYSLAVEARIRNQAYAPEWR
jgi:hypothetical protein